MIERKKFEEFVRENKRDVFFAVYSIMRSDGAASLSRDVFISIFKAGTFPKETSRYAYKYAKKHLPPRPPASVGELILDAAELRAEDVKNALGALPEQTGVIVCLCDMFGYSYGEVSSITDLSEDYVASRLSRGRKSVKEVLKRKWDLREGVPPAGECAQMLEYTDGIIDKTAGEDIVQMFEEHMNGCERCKKQFEIAKMLRAAVAEVAPRLEDSFISDVMEAADTVSRENPSFAARHKKKIVALLGSAALLVAAGLIIALVPKPVEQVQPPQTQISKENEYRIVNLFSERLTGDSSQSRSLWTADMFADLCGYGQDAAYIAFLSLSNDTPLGKSSSISYIRQSVKNGVAFYSTDLPSSEVFALCSAHLLQGCVLDGSGGGNALLVVML